MSAERLQRISVIVPRNPFISNGASANHCLCALDVGKIMEWWPGTPHAPHRNAAKVRAIQRSLDWKRVAEIAAYLLQKDITDAPDRLHKYFKRIYEPRKMDPGRQWPPKVGRVVRFSPSIYPSFSNILVHVNGARLEPAGRGAKQEAKYLVFNAQSPHLRFTVIDGQHRVNGAYFALKILHEDRSRVTWDIAADVFLNLDDADAPPRKQAQIFIDVNFYQKKVDRSLVADLFPTTRAARDPENNRERAQDIGRRLMLETGPLVGMIQIPGIKYGVQGVVALATLVGAIEDVLPDLDKADLNGLNAQTEFIAQVLASWLEASGRKEDIEPKTDESLDPENVVYQGRILVSVLTLIPACLARLKVSEIESLSDEAATVLSKFFKRIIERAGLMKSGAFIGRSEFKSRGFLGSGGRGRFRNLLWAAIAADVSRVRDEKVEKEADKVRERVSRRLNPSD
jgi:DNA-sulfur modification-associated